jgi:CRISPR system Cascade subunit CasD
MTEYLIFTIAAPMASFGGQYDPGERRNSADRPAKSGILGLIAAALGIERGEEDRLTRLRDSLHFAVRVDDPGQPAFDYHTTQVPPARRNRRFATRGDELAVPKPELKTILSTRGYRINARVSPAVWLRGDDASHSLNEISQALHQPHFTLFAGRKAHPLMLPCAPRTIQADTITAAFARFDTEEPEAIRILRDKRLTPPSRFQPPSPPLIYADLDAAGSEPRSRVEQRRDWPESASKRRFGLRQEAVLHPLLGGST